MKFFKKQSKELKEQFIIGEYELGIDHQDTVVEIDGNIIIDLVIKAHTEVFDQLCEDESFEFNYGLTAPEFYAREVDLGPKKQLEINKDNQYDYELALYFMEHNDVRVNLSIKDNWILIEGRVSMSGPIYPLKISLPVSKGKL